MIKYCIWDVGNTIYPYSLRPLHRWAESSTLDLRYYRRIGTILSYNFDNYMKGLQTNEEFARDVCDIYRISYGDRTIPEINRALHQGVGKYFPETLETIAFLQSKGIENGLLSNALPLLGDTVSIISPKLSFPSYKMGRLKPDEIIYRDVKNSLGCNYDEILFIDDKLKNVEAAKNLGIHAIVYNHDTVLNEVQNIIAEQNDKPERKVLMPGYSVIRKQPDNSL